MTGYSESLSYDNKGRLSTRSITTDQAYAIDYAYNNQGLLDSLTYPTSTSSTRVKVKYGYAYGFMNSVTDWTSGSASTVYWTANIRNHRFQTTRETLGNGVVTNRAIDAVTGFTSSIQSGVGGGARLQNQSYLYDLVGNVTQRQESNLGLTENFYYDNLYRLDYSTLNGSTNVDLSYDAMGNILTKTDVAGTGGWSYHATKKHAVTSTGTGGYSYGYDANGNMTSRNGATISWSSYNYPTLLAAGSESSGFYYGLDRQYYKQVYTGPSSTETTSYVGGLLEKVVVGSTTDWRHYISAEGQTVAIVSRKSTGTNSVSYPLEDHEGSSAVLTNSSGGSIVKESFNAFGLPRSGSTWSGAVPSGDKTLINGLTRRGYTFHSMLGDMGPIHMNGRVQDAVTGRFLSPDPTIPDPTFTQSYNRYSYVNNNPLSFIDPSGFEWKQYCASVGGVEGTDDPGLSQRCGWDWIQTPDDFLRLYGCSVRPESCADIFGTDHSNQNVFTPAGPLAPTYYPLDTEHLVEKSLDQKDKEVKKRNLQLDPTQVCRNGQAPSISNNPKLGTNAHRGLFVGVMIGAGVGLWAVSHLVEVGEAVDVVAVGWRMYRTAQGAIGAIRVAGSALEGEEALGTPLEALDANAAAYLAGGVTGAGALGVVGEAAGFAATPPGCP